MKPEVQGMIGMIAMVIIMVLTSMWIASVQL